MVRDFVNFFTLEPGIHKNIEWIRGVNVGLIKKSNKRVNYTIGINGMFEKYKVLA